MSETAVKTVPSVAPFTPSGIIAAAELLATVTAIAIEPQADESIPRFKEISSDKIVISGLPILPQDELCSSYLMEQIHTLKHLFRDGDRSGKIALVKNHSGQDLENERFRICISYTALQNQETGDLTIRFLVHSDKRDRPYIIHTPRVHPSVCKKAGINPKKARVRIPMTDCEILLHQEYFVHKCHQLIAAHFNAALLYAQQHGTKPDFFAAIPAPPRQQISN